MTEKNYKSKTNSTLNYAMTWKRRHEERGIQRVEMYLKPDVHRLLKVISEETGQSYGDIISPLIEDLSDQLAVPLWGVL